MLTGGQREMKIPARDSIKFVGRWAVGSLYICEHYNSAELVPEDAVKTWQDDEAIMCLRPQTELQGPRSPDWSNAGRSPADTSTCIWTIGVNTLIKVNSWTEGVQLEGRTIEFINKVHPEIPTTEVIYEWIDTAWDRSFMIMKRAPGIELFEAWPCMTLSQRQDVADQIAGHVKTLAQTTSTKVETVDQLGVADMHYGVGGMPLSLVPTWPSWKPWRHPPYSKHSYVEHLGHEYGCTSTEIPDVGPEFVLYNPDIHSKNIFVKWPIGPGDKGELAQIIDWEWTAYWPRWWVATCPALCHPFHMGYRGQKRPLWGDLFHAALLEIGFKDEKQWIRQHLGDYDRLIDERAGPEYFQFLEARRKARS